MKKINLFLALIFAVALIGLTNCKKDLKDSTPESKQYIETVEGSFNAIYGDVSIAKSGSPETALTPTWNVWSMYTTNKTFYPANPLFALVRGTELLSMTDAYLWWSTPANNPLGRSAGQPYSVSIPNENVRVVLEAQDVQNGDDLYLGVKDFNPSTATFPLNVEAYRIGDFLSVNADAVTSLPGANFTIGVLLVLIPFDKPATIQYMPGYNTPFGFDNIKYGIYFREYQTYSVGSGNSVIYSGNKKIISMTIFLTDQNGVNQNLAIIDGPANGKGLALTLTTTKVGWYYDTTIGIDSKDITIETREVPVN